MSPGLGSILSRASWMWLPTLILIAVAVALVGSGTHETTVPELVLADPNETYDPVKAGEPAPDGFRQLLERDQIAPVYEPVFTSADRADWPLDMLIIGITGTSEAKAYPVTHLNQREMVLDHIDGEPILVSW